MSVLCFLHFFTNLIYPSLEITSRICPEFFHVRNLFGLYVQNLSRIFHVRNLFWIHLVFVLIYCPEFVQNFYTGQILNKYWTNSGRSQIPDIGFVSKKWTISGYSGQFPDIFGDNFRTLIFHRAGVV